MITQKSNCFIRSSYYNTTCLSNRMSLSEPSLSESSRIGNVLWSQAGLILVPKPFLDDLVHLDNNMFWQYVHCLRRDAYTFLAYTFVLTFKKWFHSSLKIYLFLLCFFFHRSIKNHMIINIFQILLRTPFNR